MENETIQILELFGGIGSPRCALRNLNIPTKAIDYVEINEKAVRSYNSMFREELAYKTQTVVGWNLKPDILIHGSPCQDMSIAGHQGKATGEGRINRGKGSDEGSGTRSSLMWETIHIIENMGEWRPRYVIWENVKNVKSKYMRPNFDRYMVEMERLGYTNNFEVLDAREFGLPQARERVFTVSVLNGEKFEFDDLIRTPMRTLQEFLEDDASVPDVYDVTQPSVLACIGEKGIRRATVIKDCAYTMTCGNTATPTTSRRQSSERRTPLTIEISLLLSGVSVAFAIFFGICSKQRNEKKDTQEDAEQRATTDTMVMMKLENIADDLKDIKRESRENREEMKSLRDRVVIVEQSLKSYHKRLDGEQHSDR